MLTASDVEADGFNNSRSDEPTSRLSDDFGNSSSSEVSESNPNLQSSGNNQQVVFGVDAFLDPESQEVTSSEKMSSISRDTVGLSLQEVFHSIKEFVDLNGRRHEGLGSTPFTDSQMEFSLNSDETDESSESERS